MLQLVNCLLLLPPAQGTRPRPPVWFSFQESLCPPPQGPYLGPCCSPQLPGCLLTASVAPQSAAPCLCMPAGQPGGTVETGRIRRRNLLSVLREAGGSATGQRLLGRKPCPGKLLRVSGAWLGNSRRVWAQRCCLGEPWGLSEQPYLLCSQTPETQDFHSRSEASVHSGLSRDEWDAQSQLLFLRRWWLSPEEYSQLRIELGSVFSSRTSPWDSCLS